MKKQKQKWGSDRSTHFCQHFMNILSRALLVIESSFDSMRWAHVLCGMLRQRISWVRKFDDARRCEGVLLKSRKADLLTSRASRLFHELPDRRSTILDLRRSHRYIHVWIQKVFSVDWILIELKLVWEIPTVPCKRPFFKRHVHVSFDIFISIGS